MKNQAPVKKTLFIEAQRLFRKQKHGMDVVALELLQRLKGINTFFDMQVLVKQDEDHCIESTEHLHVNALPSAFYPFWEQRNLPAFTSKTKNAWLHCTGNTAPMWGSTPLIVTIHDLIFLEDNYLLKRDGGGMYQRFRNVYRSLVVPMVAKKAKHIITVSDFQRHLIIKKFKIPSNKVTVVYNGADERFFKVLDKAEKKAIVARYGIEGFPYIFFLANTEPRKNTDGVIKAFVKFCKQHPQFKQKLVIKGLTKEQLNKKINCLGANELIHRFHRVGYIAYEDLPALYQGASMLWFPSFSEGFGLPIIEAMAGGTPVITSNVSVMPEIAGDAALYINPADTAQLVNQTMQLLTNIPLKNDIVRRGFLQAEKFTWNNSIQQLLKVYSKVMG